MRLFYVISCLSVSLFVQAQKKSTHQGLQSLIQAEYNFADISKEKGIKEAFLSVLADDAVLFRPHPVNGKKWMAESPEDAGLLIWKPVWADISQAGDIGYTTGPFEYSAKKDSLPVNYGHYVSIWKKNTSADWQLVMDVGISHDKSVKNIDLTLPERKSNRKEKNLKPVSLTETHAALLQRDRLFTEQLKENGLVTYSLYLTDSARLYRNGYEPFIGKKSIQQFLQSQNHTLTSQPAQAFVASSGDLGYTYGSATIESSANNKPLYLNYIRIWRLQADKTWKIVLDIHVNGAPPKKE